MRIFQITANKNSYEQALQCFHRAIESAPQNALMYASRAICLTHLGCKDAALSDLETAKSLIRNANFENKSAISTIEEIEAYFANKSTFTP